MTTKVYVVEILHKCDDKDCHKKSTKVVFDNEKDAAIMSLMFLVRDEKTIVHEALISYLSNKEESSSDNN